MKRSYLLLFLLVTSAIGCSKNSGGGMPVKDVVIDLLLEDKDGGDILMSEIDDIYLALFDGDGKFLDERKFSKAYFSGSRQLSLAIPESTSHMVCWANAGKYSQITPLDEQSYIGDGKIEHTSAGVGVAETGDKLFYASEGGVVAAMTRDDKKEYSLRFERAHLLIDVYVMGHVDSGAEEGAAPIVRINSFASGYDFAKRLLDNKIDYQQKLRPIATPDGPAAGTRFVTPELSDGEPALLHVVRPSDGGIDYTLDLQKFVEKHEMTDEYWIVIMIEFIESEVRVTIPSWSKQPVEPEF